MWDKTITLYNKFCDVNGQIYWHRHTISNCFFKNINKKTVSGDTEKIGNETIIRIPKQSNFIPCFNWVSLSNDIQIQYMTLKSGDIIVLGDVNDTIDEYQNSQRSSDLIAKYKALGCIIVSSANINTDLPKPHYLVRGN